MSQFIPRNTEASPPFYRKYLGQVRWIYLKTVNLARLGGERVRDITRSKEEKSIELRRLELVDFYNQFEQYVEVLCDGAQYGPVEGLEQHYSVHKAYLIAHYEMLKQYLSAYIRPLPSDAEQCMLGIGRFGDVFESLFAYNSLKDFLEADDGYMISRITRAREALMRYGEHLRMLNS